MSRIPDARKDAVAYRIAWLLLLTGFALLASFIAADLLYGTQGERSVQTFEREARRFTDGGNSAATAASTDAEPLRMPSPDAIPETVNRVHEPQTPHRAPASFETSQSIEGVLRIPALGLRVPVYSGTDEFALSRGAGRVEWTPPLGSGGNVGIAAHRDRAFRALKDIGEGDEIHVDMLDGTRLYKVVRIHVVDPEDVHVLAQTETPYLTLVTCYPFNFVGSAPQRFIVHARLSDEPAALVTVHSTSADESDRVGF